MSGECERTGKEYSFEVVERCEELYCVDGHSFDAVATITGVAASTLKRWSERYGWQAKKEEIRQALSAIRRDRILVRAKMLRKCLEDPNAKDAYAVSALESMAVKAAELALKQEQIAAPDRPPREIRTEADAAAALEEAVQMKLNAMLASPGRISLAAVKDIKQAMALIKDMRGADAGDGGPKALDAAGIQALRAQLGL